MASTTDAPPTTAAEAPKDPVPPAAAPAPPPPTALAAPRREQIVTTFDPKDPISFYLDTGIFEQLQRVAKMMATSSLVPAHLQQKVSDCFLVVAQAFRWGMDPFSVAQHTFVLKGKLGYEGKLIAALVNASGRVEGNLRPSYSGTGDARKIVITGRLKGETQDREVEGTVGGWKTDNEMWRKDPDQIGYYRGAREWARRHMPEVVLGIIADEELVDREPLVKVDGGTRHVAALELVTDQVAQRNAAETAAPAKDDEGGGTGGAAQASAPEPVKGEAPAQAAEVLRCDHGILLTGACPKCIAATKGEPAQGRIVGEDDDDPKPTAAATARASEPENPFLKKQREAASKEAAERDRKGK